ncbi:MAG: TolC family protein [Pirellulaceae bacterium]
MMAELARPGRWAFVLSGMLGTFSAGCAGSFPQIFSGDSAHVRSGTPVPLAVREPAPTGTGHPEAGQVSKSENSSQPARLPHADPASFVAQAVALPVTGAAGSVVATAAYAQPEFGPSATEEPLQPPVVTEDVHVPAAVAPGADASTAHLLGVTDPVPIDLGTALLVTAGQNPQVQFALQRIQESYAQLRLAQVLWVPSIRAGVNYNKHDGVIQNVEGDMLSTSRSSVYAGLGGRAVGAGSPAMPGLVIDVPVRDVLFQPRIAEQAWGASQHASTATHNDALLRTAVGYMDLLESLQVLAIAQETLENTEQLNALTTSFAETGQGLQADADRARTELSLRAIEVRRAAENARVASVRLARVLGQQDLSQTLLPQEPSLTPFELVETGTPVGELVAVGLSNRPELAENRYLVGAAIERLRRECYAPLLPSVLLGLSYGGNGGSPTSRIDDFGDRVDFDAAAVWELRNLGWGERSARGVAQSRLEQARWQQVQVMDQVASEIAEAHAQVDSRQAQIELAQAGIRAAEDSFRHNTDRIRDGQGLPIETLQSIQALDQARRQYVRAVADYNRAQFQLHRALGWPIL